MLGQAYWLSKEEWSWPLKDIDAFEFVENGYRRCGNGSNVK